MVETQKGRLDESKEQWNLLKQSNKASLEILYQLYSNKLYNYGSKFSADKDLITESIQELFVTLWTRRDFLGDPTDVKNYLYKAFRLSLFKKVARSRKNATFEDTEAYVFEVSLSAEDNVIDTEKKDEVIKLLEKTLKQLTVRQREAIFLKFYEERSYVEIAEIMDITVKGGYKLIGRAIEALRDALNRKDLMSILILIYGSGINNS